MAKATEEFTLTHAYLNTLIAGFQGSFVSANVCRQLGYQVPGLPGMEGVKPILDWLAPRMKALWTGEATAPERMDESFSLLKRELTVVAALTTRALNALQDEADLDGVKLITASSARCAYGREHYINGLISYCECFELPEQADLWRQRLLAAQQDVFQTSALFNVMLKGPALDERFRLELWNDHAGLSGAFKSQLNDLAAIEGRRAGGYLLEAIGLPEPAFSAWKALGLPAETCGWWLSFQFSAEEASAWMKAGFTDAAYAGAWKARGFDLPAAAECHNAGLTPRQAYQELIELRLK